jgi:hypothetical protein
MSNAEVAQKLAIMTATIEKWRERSRRFGVSIPVFGHDFLDFAVSDLAWFAHPRFVRPICHPHACRTHVPMVEKVAPEVVELPMFPQLTEEAQTCVVREGAHLLGVQQHAWWRRVP